MIVTSAPLYPHRALLAGWPFGLAGPFLPPASTSHFQSFQGLAREILRIAKVGSVKAAIHPCRVAGRS